jgi:hypothetical protein
LNVKLEYDAAILFLVKYWRNRIYSHTETCAQMFTAASFIITPGGDDTNIHQLMDE